MPSCRLGIQAGWWVMAVMLLTGGATRGDSWVEVTPEGIPTVRAMTGADAPRLTVNGHDETGISVSVDVPGFALMPRRTPAGEFVEVSWPDASVVGDFGTPALPVVRRLFIAPRGTTVSFIVREGEAMTIDSETADTPLRLLPVQPPIPKIPGARENADFIFDEAVYATNAEVLVDRAVIVELGFVRGQRLLLLEVRPLDYNPVVRKIEFWPTLDVEVHFSGEPGPFSLQAPLPGLHDVLLNPDSNAPGQRGYGNYLIIVGTALESAIAPFAAAKEAQGFTVTTHSVPPGTSRSTIKSYIQSLWGDPPSPSAPDYLLLVGDTQAIPHWLGQGTGSPDTDLQYACMDGSSDWYPDIALGRFPVDNSAELQIIVDKTLYYENGPLADPDYAKRAVFMAGDDNWPITEGTHNYVITAHMDPHDFRWEKLYEHTYNAATQDVRNAFNDGRFYGIYSGHGSSTSWADGPPFSTSNINSLVNQDLYAMVCSFACLTGNFADYDECFMESWVLADGKGAVTAWGSSVNSYWTEDDILEKRLFDAICDNSDEVKTEIGPIYNEAKLRYLAHFGPTSTTRRYFEMYNLMGDPGLSLPGVYEDCNHNGSPDDADIAAGTSLDANANGVPDECEVVAPIPMTFAKMNRYISFGPNNPDIGVAFRLELAAGPGLPGKLGWVGEPEELGCPDNCSGKYLSRVVNAPVYRVWAEPAIYVGDCEIVPVATYFLRATGDMVNFTEPVELETITQPAPKHWGDVVGPKVWIYWAPPDGVVNMDDVQGAVTAFRRAEDAPSDFWVDVDGEVPNMVINMTDILQIILGFEGQPYSFSNPSDCP